jgi:hypothetical protein
MNTKNVSNRSILHPNLHSDARRVARLAMVPIAWLVAAALSAGTVACGAAPDGTYPEPVETTPSAVDQHEDDGGVLAPLPEPTNVEPAGPSRSDEPGVPANVQGVKDLQAPRR